MFNKKSFWDYINDKGGTVTETIITPHGSPDLEITAVSLKKRNSIKVYVDDVVVARDEDELCEYLYVNYNMEIRFCDYCGTIMQAGYTDDDGDFYNCEDCFELDMNERYGEGNWRELDEENDLGGYYEFRKDENSEWQPEPSYYTEWY